MLVVGLFLLSGLVFPKITYTYGQEVNLPLTETFELFNDASKMKDWMTGLQSFKTIEEKPGLVGSRYEIVVDAQGEFVRMEELVTAFKQNEKVGLTIESDEMIKKDFYTFQAKGNQTFIQNKASITGKTYFLKCLFASFYFFIKGEDQAILDSFKAYAEGSSSRQ